MSEFFRPFEGLSFKPEPYPKPPPSELVSDLWGELSSEVIQRERIEQTPGAKTYFIPHARRRLAVEVTGDPSGYPVLFLPGTPGWRGGPKPDASLLPPGVRLFTWDRPGYGFSCPLPGRLAIHSYYDCWAITNYFGIKQFGVVGRSGGTGHALAIAACHPGAERAAVIVPTAPYNLMKDALGKDAWFEGMGELNTKVYGAAFADPDTYNPFPPSRRPILSAAPIPSLEEHIRQMTRTLRIEAILGMKGFLNGLTDELLSREDLGIKTPFLKHQLAAQRFGIQGRTDDIFGQNDWGFNLSTIKIPTLIWAAGESDIFAPPIHAVFLADQLGDIATLHLEPDATHFHGVEATNIGVQWCTY